MQPSTLTLSPVNQASPGAGITDSDGVTWWPILPAGNRCVKLLKNDTVTVTLSAPKAQPAAYSLIADAVRIVTQRRGDHVDQTLVWLQEPRWHRAAGRDGQRVGNREHIPMRVSHAAPKRI